MKIVSLLLCKPYGPRLKIRRNSACHSLGSQMANPESISYVEINTAGNGFRGHGIAVPARSYSQKSGTSTHHDSIQTQK